MSEHWVVVGGGSAGCVAAARLSADDARRVTLLEAGPDLAEGAVPDAVSGPDFFVALAAPGRTHDGLVAARTAGGMRRPYRVGRGLGGSSAVNAMIARRGDPARYRSWGWHDTEHLWDRIALPVEPADPHELGAVDRALLAADAHSERALLTRRNHRRVTSAEAYLWPARTRENLMIRADSPVRRIVLDRRRAVGVVLDDGTEIGADRVVLAAGAIHTPALMLRSGVDTPGIGLGLQDHPSAALTLELRDRTYPGGLAAGAIAEYDGVQLLALNHLGPDAPGLGMLMVAVMAPHGRAGTVSVGPGDDGPPIVDLGLLDDDRDVATLVRGVRRALDLLDADVFREQVAAVHIDEHGTTSAALADGDELVAWARTATGDYVHAAASCAIGAVLDDAGAVRGYEQLYVCDASAFPAIPDANLHLPTTMLAERLCERWNG